MTWTSRTLLARLLIGRTGSLEPQEDKMALKVSAKYDLSVFSYHFGFNSWKPETG